MAALAGVGLVSLLHGRPAHAAEELFGYLYTTDTEPRGRFEFEQWATAGLGTARGSYASGYFREEIEYGVTDNYQAALYMNFYSVRANRNLPDGTTGGTFVPESASPYRPYGGTKLESFSFENKVRVLSPYLNPVGLALYFEPSVGPGFVEFEGKVIVQKNFLDDRLVTLANLNAGIEAVGLPGNPLAEPGSPETRRRWERSTAVELVLGAAYRFAPKWFGGLEFDNHNDFGGVGVSKGEHSAFSLGPNIHYAGEGFWATLTVLPQLPFGRPYTADQRGNFAGGQIFDEHSKLEIRLRVGVEF